MTAGKCSGVIFSSTGALRIAEAIKAELEYFCYTRIWNQDMIQIGGYTLDALVEALRASDFAIVLMTPDDSVVVPTETSPSPCPRDNVVMEFGLAIGILGRERVFTIVERSPRMRLPSDMAGFNTVSFERPSHDDYRPAVGYSCNSVKTTLGKLGPKIGLARIPTVGAVEDPSLRALAQVLAADAVRAVECLVHNESARNPERQYLDYLTNEVTGLGPRDLLMAICGGKNWSLGEVYRYLNENVALAQREVRVYRIYVAPSGVFPDREVEVIAGHLEWARQLPSFEVGVLLGEAECWPLQEFRLPEKFGMVLTRHSGLWKSRIHFGLDEHSQGGWEFADTTIIQKHRQLFESLLVRSRQPRDDKRFESMIGEAIPRLAAPEPRLWRFGGNRPNELLPESAPRATGL